MILGRTLFVCCTASLFLLLLVVKKGSFRVLCTIYTWLIAVLALFTEPKYDLYNYVYGRMRQMSQMSLPAFWKEFGGSAEIISQFYFFVLSKLPYRGFLMFFSVLIVYSLIFQMVFRAEKRWELNKQTLIILIIWVVGTTPYYTVLGGVRYQIAFTIFGYALYCELVEKRHKVGCWLGYIAAVFIHNSAVVLLLLRLLLLIYNRFTGWAVTLTVLAVTVSIMPIINTLSTVLDSQFLLQILDKATVYYGSGGSDLSTGNWVIAVMMAICGLIALLVKRGYSAGEDGIQDMGGYMLLLLMFCLGSITTSDVFVRFGTAIKFAALPLFASGFHTMQTRIEQTPQSRYIRHSSTPAGISRLALEFALLVSAAMYLGYQYLGKLTLMTLRWPPV